MLLCGSCRRQAVSIAALGPGEAEPLIRVRLTVPQEQAVVAIDGPFIVRQGRRVLFSGSRLGGCRLLSGPDGFYLGKLRFAGELIDLVPQRDGALRFAGRRYRGFLRCYRRGSPAGLVVVNVVKMESYLASVVGAEMPASFRQSALEAQAVAARNTLLSTLKRHHYYDPFDICATDHCQVYLGVKGENAMSSRAVEETCGEILVLDGKICDTRFAKVCGGITENFENVWGGEGRDYLISHRDSDTDELVLHNEEEVRNFIDDPPPSFCSDHELFRWKVRVDRKKLESIVRKKMGTALELVAIEPVKRGASGRITEIKLIGTKRELIIRGELRIRKALSESHLFSSLFYVVRLGEKDGLPDAFEFRGGGFGHGVGMCQIGAIGMARRGYNYREILAHYYPGTELVKVE